jgi:poly(hydroxyalkanoate) granule-associated protein
MATFKKPVQKTAKKPAKKAAGKAGARVSPQQQAERLSRSLSESAQQIWLAGVGAFGRAQAEGTKLFEGLVKEGLNLEQHARKFAGGQAEVVRDAVESKVGQARERAVDTWDRLEKVFEERVHKALVKLDVPGRNDLADLSRRVDGLTSELRRQGSGTTRTAAGTARKAPARKAAAKKSTTKVAASKPAARKSARKAIATPRKPITP